MRLAVITPFHDPRWLNNALSNFARQTDLKFLPVIVLNGAARSLAGSVWGGVPSALARADGISAALQTGVDWARARGCTHALVFDSDDEYGAGYVMQARAALERADFCGKRAVFARLADGLHLFERPGGMFLGGTIGFALDKFVPMPHCLQNDATWHANMRTTGASEIDTGPEQYVYRRHGSNAHWRANDTIVRRAWGASTHYPQAAGDLLGVGVRRETPSDEEVLAAL